MGRPKEHDERTRTELLAAAERLVAEGGLSELSVRAVADRAGTSTRAVYSVFGSKDGLLVQALARRAFEFLYAEIAKLEETDDPAVDLVDVGVLVVRRLVREHPALYRIAFQRVVPGMDAGPELTAARQRAWHQLVGKVERLEAAGQLGGKVTRRGSARVQRHDGRPRQRGAAGGGASTAAGGQRGGGLRSALQTVIRGFA